MASWTGLLQSLPSTNLSFPAQASWGPGNARMTGPTIVPQYKMHGYYVAGVTYEEWVAYGYPNTTPPSGHTLVNVTFTRLQ